MSIPKWIKHLEPICRYDEARDRAKWWYVGAMVLLGCVLMFGSGSVADWIGSPVPFLVSPILFVILIFFSIHLHKLDVNDNVRNTIFPLLHVLALEIGHNKKVQLKINFSKPLKSNDLSGEEDKGSFFSPNKSMFYSYDVLELHCTFLDGTKLTWLLNDTIRKRKRKTARGKVKIKEKLKRRLTTTLVFNKKRYQLSAKPPKIRNQSIKIKEDENKIVYRNTLKSSAPGRYSPVSMEQIINEAKIPYRYLSVVGAKT